MYAQSAAIFMTQQLEILITDNPPAHRLLICRTIGYALNAAFQRAISKKSNRSIFEDEALA